MGALLGIEEDDDMADRTWRFAETVRRRPFGPSLYRDAEFPGLCPRLDFRFVE